VRIDRLEDDSFGEFRNIVELDLGPNAPAELDAELHTSAGGYPIRLERRADGVLVGRTHLPPRTTRLLHAQPRLDDDDFLETSWLDNLDTPMPVRGLRLPAVAGQPGAGDRTRAMRRLLALDGWAVVSFALPSDGGPLFEGAATKADITIHRVVARAETVPREPADDGEASP
jgi:hypothetical protein